MNVNRDKLLIAVMSYNMGELLRNCLASVERNANGCRVAIFDDASSDAVTQSILDEYRTRIDIIGPAESAEVERKTGGLHSNMNQALEYAVGHDCEYVLFIQDDMQLVRAIDDEVLDEYAAIFASAPSIAMIRCVFMKSPVVSPDHTARAWKPSLNGTFYERYPVSYGVLDTGIVSICRLNKAGFRFMPGERNNAIRSREMGLRTVFPKNPLIMWLPWPPTSLARLTLLKRAINRATDRIFGIGCHRFRDMTPSEVDAMRTRPMEQLPYAERFLSLTGKDVPKPWCYEHSYVYPIALARELSSGRWPWREIQ